MKSMVVYSPKPRKMLSFSTTKVDNVNVLCIDPATVDLLCDKRFQIKGK